METFKLVYEIRYPKMLNFRELYKEIINPYFVYPNTQYSISGEGTHTESIKLTFLDSNHILIFGLDRISFQHDCTSEDLKISGGHIQMCFDIYEKLKLSSTFYKVTAELIELTLFKELDKSSDSIREDFIKSHNIKKIIKNNSDVGVVIEGNEHDLFSRIHFGPFGALKDIDELALFVLDQKRKLEVIEKNGIIARCTIKNNIDSVSIKTYKKLLEKAQSYIAEIFKNYE